MAVKRYPISDWSKVGEMWRKYTGLSPQLLHIDTELCEIYGFLMLDLEKFEDEIYRLHSEYDRCCTSVSFIIRHNYGDEAVNLINSLL